MPHASDCYCPGAAAKIAGTGSVDQAHINKVAKVAPHPPLVGLIRALPSRSWLSLEKERPVTHPPRLSYTWIGVVVARL